MLLLVMAAGIIIAGFYINLRLRKAVKEDVRDVEYDGKTKEDIKEEMLEEEKETQQAIIDDYEDNPEESSYGEEDYEQALRTIKDIEGGTFEVDEDELDER